MIDTGSHVDQNGTVADVYAVPVCPGSQRRPPNGLGQFGSLGVEGTTVAVVRAGAVVAFGCATGSGSTSGSSSSSCGTGSHDPPGA